MYYAGLKREGAAKSSDDGLTPAEQLVLIDADARRLCGSPADIARSTLAALAALRVGGEPIPTLAQMLALADGGVPLLLEAKIDERFGPVGPALLAALEGYRGPVGVMSFDPRLTWDALDDRNG